MKKTKKGLKMNKKAGINFLGEKTTDIVIAVLVIILLVFVGVKIFGIFSDKTDLEKAKNNLNSLVIDFENFMKTDKTHDTLMVLGPEDWYIKFFDEGYSSKKCEGYTSGFCLCICNGKNVKDCDEEGICAELKEKWTGDNEYEMKEIPFEIEVKKNA